MDADIFGQEPAPTRKSRDAKGRPIPHPIILTPLLEMPAFP